MSEKEEVQIQIFSFGFSSLCIYQLKKYSYGKHILAHLEKTMPDSSRVLLSLPLSAHSFTIAESCYSPTLGTKQKLKAAAAKAA